MNIEDDKFAKLLRELQELSGKLDQPDAWPAESIRRMQATGVCGWMVPVEFGGAGISSGELALRYRALAEACLVSTFVLTQFNAAVQRLDGSDNQALRAELLPALQSGQLFATVGISHLTTSRQHLARPSVQVRETADGLTFNGMIPWTTGAPFADVIVTGGTLDDGRQVLAALPADSDGITIGEPAKLMALNASRTGPVYLRDVEVKHDRLMAGPVEAVMKVGKTGGAGGLTTSALALGAAARSVHLLRREATTRPDLSDVVQTLSADHSRLVDDLTVAVDDSQPTERQMQHSNESIRQRANSLVLRASQAALAASKGAGFVSGHPAERAVREAMFFLVWSCPQPVLTANLRELACMTSGGS